MLKQRKQIKVTITKLLKIIELLYKHKDYDHVDEIYKRIASGLKYQLLDSEIEEFAAWYLSEDAENMGYDKEHYEDAKTILEYFVKNYCNSPNRKEK